MLMPKERTMTLEPSEFCIKVFVDIDSKEERSGEQEHLHKELRKYEEILEDKETPLSREISRAGYP